MSQDNIVKWLGFNNKDNFSQHEYVYYKNNISLYKMLHISTLNSHCKVWIDRKEDS
jgi:hypothetical protein